MRQSRSDPDKLISDSQAYFSDLDVLFIDSHTDICDLYMLLSDSHCHISDLYTHFQGDITLPAVREALPIGDIRIPDGWEKSNFGLE
ncbi:hypothetical protein DF185_13875 [Marinifilum breve]|uniref:Uncharacterized protein n=1 Tax=Marinifilum breve TaxID=2184082 RepID=A0A2V3ZV77_9BACT|nr:hypothetical protein [Marinifilum breve]PXX98967.1 hypothetical protein DF185_13875 [Marinifilum breve]